MLYDISRLGKFLNGPVVSQFEMAVARSALDADGPRCVSLGHAKAAQAREGRRDAIGAARDPQGYGG